MSPSSSLFAAQFGEELRRRYGGHQGGTPLFVVEKSSQRADTNQVVVHHLLWDGDDENQVDGIFRVAKGDAGPAAPDPEEQLFDQPGAGVRESDPAVGDGRAFALPFHDRRKKFLRFAQFPSLAQALDDFPDRFARRAAAQIERDMFWIEQGIEERRDHVELID